MVAQNFMSTTAWQKLSAQVVDDEPTCQLQLDGCTGLSETADHIIPVSVNKDLAMVRSNLQGACKSCNSTRGNRDLYTIVRPPALAYFDTE